MHYKVTENHKYFLHLKYFSLLLNWALMPKGVSLINQLINQLIN